jgi:DNA-binding XRE family transcriptional regulator
VIRQTVNAIELGKYSPSLELAFQIDAARRIVPAKTGAGRAISSLTPGAGL